MVRRGGKSHARFGSLWHIASTAERSSRVDVARGARSARRLRPVIPRDGEDSIVAQLHDLALYDLDGQVLSAQQAPATRPGQRK